MSRVFVDSSAFFALIAREDRHHKEAAVLFASADRENWELVTTNATLFECHALLLNRSRALRCVEFRRHGTAWSDRCNRF